MFRKWSLGKVKLLPVKAEKLKIILPTVVLLMQVPRLMVTKICLSRCSTMAMIDFDYKHDEIILIPSRNDTMLRGAI